MANPLSKISFSRQILPLLALAGLIIAAIWIWSDLPDRELVEPEEKPVQATGDLANSARVAGSGIVEPSSEIIAIGTAVSGLVTDVRVTPGEQVAKGQPLFTVDARTARSRVSEARANIGEAEAAIAEAQAAINEANTARQTASRQLALFRNVDDPAAISRSEVIRAEGEVDAANARAKLAQSRLSQARARLTAARATAASASTELSRLTVRAPITGEILNVAVRPGEHVSTVGGNQTFIEMGQTNPLHIRIDVDESEAARVDIGAPATVSARGDAGNSVKAEFVRAEPQVVPKRSLTNSAAERVDVRVLQLIYALPSESNLRVGQQVDAFVAAKDESE
jgi:multidrug resistance efflux pump